MKSMLVLVVLSVVAVSPAYADPHVSPGSTAYFVGVHEQRAGSSGSSQTVGSAPVDPVVDSVESIACSAMRGDQTCAEPLHCENGDIMVVTTVIFQSGRQTDVGSNCPEEVVSAPTPTVIPGMVAAAFRRIPLPASELMVQPPGGRTLVNFETNFYTEAGEFMRTVRLLGRRVELRIWPVSFGWRFGDGETRRTTEPGARYPDLEITHRYLSRGRVSPSVDTTYAAQFRVGDGSWRAVNGTVTIPGTPEGLRVVTARPVLVGY